MGNESIGCVRVKAEKPLRHLVPSAANFNAALNCQLQRLHETSFKSSVLLAAVFSCHVLIVTKKGISKHSVSTGEVEARFEMTVAVACVAQDPDLLVIGTGAVVKLVSPVTLTAVAQLDHSPFPVCSVAYLPGGRVLAGLTSGKILQWSLQQQQPVVQYYSEGCTQFLAFSPRHKLIATDHFRAGKSNVVLYNADTGVATQELSSTEGRCLGVAFIDSRNLVTALTTQGQMLGWDVLSGNTLFAVAVSPNLPPNTSFRGMSFLRLKEEDLLLFCTSSGLMCADLQYDYTDMQFTLTIRGKLILAKEAPVLSCSYDSSADVLCVTLEDTGAALVNLFSQSINNTAVQQEAKQLPLFSLHSVPIPQRPDRKKKPDLPLFDLALPHKKEPQPSPPKAGPSEDILQRIRSRVEGKPRQSELVPTRAGPLDTPDDSSLLARTSEQLQASTAKATLQVAEEKPARVSEPARTAEDPPAEVIEEPTKVTETVPVGKVEELSASTSENLPAGKTEAISVESEASEAKSAETSAEKPQVSVVPVPEVPPEVVVKEVQKPTKVETGFQRFLRVKKAELLQASPTLTSKEVVFKVSELWGALTEEEQQEFESNP